MTKIAFLFTLLGTALVCSVPAAPAQATGAARTFVSAAGSDANNCINVATPCRHLAAAYAATAPNGEIYVLDPANYGSLTITGPVSIEGHGWASIAPVSGSAAITINTNLDDNINIIGVVLDGTGLANTTGIQFNFSGNLNVQDSVIRNFTLNGILFQSNSSAVTRLSVSNTLISDNGGNGISIVASGSGITYGILDHIKMLNNAQNGLIVDTSTQTVNVTVTDSVSANNSVDGIVAQSDGSTQVNVMVRNCTIANNTIIGLWANGSNNSTLRVTRSTITGNGEGWVGIGGGGLGTVLSYGDNNIDGNGTNNTEPPGPLVYH